MIKFTGRRNILYMIQLAIWSFARMLVKFFLEDTFRFIKSQLFTFLMFMGEFTGGLIVHLYQRKYLKIKENKFLVNQKKNTISIENKKQNKFKIFSLLFMAAFLDFVEFNISSFYVANYMGISYSFNLRLFTFLVICNALSYRCILKFPIHKHQKFALVIIFACFIITIISEYFFQPINIYITYGGFITVICFIFLQYICTSTLDISDKYLMEFESFDAFLIITYEGLFGCIITMLSFIYENPNPEVYKIYKYESTGRFALFLFLLFLFYIFSALRNSFSIMTNKIYSPLELTLSNYFVNPLYIIYSYIDGEDFLTKDGQNVFYFLINFIISILALFSTLIYNEFIVIFCCGLEHNTYLQISRRSKLEDLEMEIKNLSWEGFDDNKEGEETEEEEKEGEEEIKKSTYNIYV